jgi:hypothetical protein
MMKVGDMVQWGDQVNYPGLSGIVTKTRKDSYEGQFHTHEPREIFVHWLNFQKDYMAGEGWEEETSVRILSSGKAQ